MFAQKWWLNYISWSDCEVLFSVFSYSNYDFCTDAFFPLCPYRKKFRGRAEKWHGLSFEWVVSQAASENLMVSSHYNVFCLSKQIYVIIWCLCFSLIGMMSTQILEQYLQGKLFHDCHTLKTFLEMVSYFFLFMYVCKVQSRTHQLFCFCLWTCCSKLDLNENLISWLKLNVVPEYAGLPLMCSLSLFVCPWVTNNPLISSQRLEE